MGIAAIIFVVLIVLLLVGMPIAFAIGGAVVTTILCWDKVNLVMNFQQMYQGVDSFGLIALPMFIWAGNLMNEGGIISDLLRLCRVLCGRIRGCVAHANIVGSMFFAGISGSATADTAAIGGMLIPAMVEDGYDADFSAAVTASSSVIGPIIPPSIGMVLYGSTMGLSVSALFIGGALPGILLGVSLMIVAAYYSKKRNYPKNTEKYTPKQIGMSIVKSLPSVILMAIILGGILGGVLTPTEASSIAVLYALFIGLFYYRTLTPKKILITLIEAMVTAGAVLAIVSISTPLGRMIALAQIPKLLGDAIVSLTNSKYIFLLLFNLFMLFMGMVMESNANLLIFAPIFAPIAMSFGVNPIHFGVIFILNVIIGLATPPFGVCMFMAADIAKISVEKTAKAILPFCAMELVVLLLVTYIEPIATFLPRLCGLMS